MRIELSEDKHASRLLHHPVMQLEIRFDQNEKMTPTLQAVLRAQMFQAAEACAAVNVRESTGRGS